MMANTHKREINGYRTNLKSYIPNKTKKRRFSGASLIIS